MLGLLRMTPLGRLARRARWTVSPAAGPVGVGRLSVRVPRSVVESGVPADWVVRVENHSRRVWPAAGPGAVRVRHRWVSLTGRPYGEPAGVPLPRTLLPGDWADLAVPVAGPAAPGDFSLEWDVEVGGAPAGGPLAEAVPVHVVFPRATDIDYHHVFRTADLAANSWWVVGAYHSQEEYKRSSEARRVMLVGQGLTPDSRVLDIGCGTGQMAMALEGYLSDRGAYYGTDIGREAVEFCRRTYRRPNFVFDVGGMTAVPFPDAAGPLDLAVFFSVFTHTFVDESALLLAECGRLLGPQGAVIADVIASPLVARGAGHRGEMRVNRDHFLRICRAVGFQPKVIATFPWAADAERLLLRLDRR
ncbi:MAG: class I SAM-dependent methyltransferase [Gemmataceae bacterium]|nr:class I SAM-dependent methyltransferase [Gemmataceae bacterium]